MWAEWPFLVLEFLTFLCSYVRTLSANSTFISTYSSNYVSAGATYNASCSYSLLPQTRFPAAFYVHLPSRGIICIIDMLTNLLNCHVLFLHHNIHKCWYLHTSNLTRGNIVNTNLHILIHIHGPDSLTF